MVLRGHRHEFQQHMQSGQPALTTMQYRQLGTTDLHVSAIGLGCVTFGREIDRDASFRVLDRAVEAGITLLDTAESYGDGASERVLGEWMTERDARSRVVLITKVAPPLTSLEQSLQRLHTDCVDLFLLHSWDNDVPLEESFSALTSLVEQGKARYVGCSNFTASQLRRSLQTQDREGHTRMACIQPIYNLVHREIEEAMLPLCQAESVGVITYSPLGAGFLTGKYTRNGPIPEGTRFAVKPGHQRIYFSERGFRIVEDLRRRSAETGQSMIQLALGWAFSRPGITSTLIGARNTGHIEQALQAFD